MEKCGVLHVGGMRPTNGSHVALSAELLVFLSGLTGPIVIDYKGDRIMNYDVWYLPSGGDMFLEYMVIPLSLTGRNATACVKWLVRIFSA